MRRKSGNDRKRLVKAPKKRSEGERGRLGRGGGNPSCGKVAAYGTVKGGGQK